MSVHKAGGLANKSSLLGRPWIERYSSRSLLHEENYIVYNCRIFIIFKFAPNQQPSRAEPNRRSAPLGSHKCAWRAVQTNNDFSLIDKNLDISNDIYESSKTSTVESTNHIAQPPHTPSACPCTANYSFPRKQSTDGLVYMPCCLVSIVSPGELGAISLCPLHRGLLLGIDQTGRYKQIHMGQPCSLRFPLSCKLELEHTADVVAVMCCGFMVSAYQPLLIRYSSMMSLYSCLDYGIVPWFDCIVPFS